MKLYLIVIEFNGKFELFRICDSENEARYWASRVKHYLHGQRIVIVEDEIYIHTTTLS